MRGVLADVISDVSIGTRRVLYDSIFTMRKWSILAMVALVRASRAIWFTIPSPPITAAAKIAMITTTTNNSIRVTPERDEGIRDGD